MIGAMGASLPAGSGWWLVLGIGAALVMTDAAVRIWRWWGLRVFARRQRRHADAVRVRVRAERRFGAVVTRFFEGEHGE